MMIIILYCIFTTFPQVKPLNYKKCLDWKGFLYLYLNEQQTIHFTCFNQKINFMDIFAYGMLIEENNMKWLLRGS